MSQEKEHVLEGELDKLIKEESGKMLYLTILETCTKFKLFTNPERMIIILFGTLKGFLDKLLNDINNENQKKDLRTIIEQVTQKLCSEFKT